MLVAPPAKRRRRLGGAGGQDGDGSFGEARYGTLTDDIGLVAVRIP